MNNRIISLGDHKLRAGDKHVLPGGAIYRIKEQNQAINQLQALKVGNIRFVSPLEDYEEHIPFSEAKRRLTDKNLVPLDLRSFEALQKTDFGIVDSLPENRHIVFCGTALAPEGKKGELYFWVIGKKGKVAAARLSPVSETRKIDNKFAFIVYDPNNDAIDMTAFDSTLRSSPIGLVEGRFRSNLTYKDIETISEDPGAFKCDLIIIFEKDGSLLGRMSLKLPSSVFNNGMIVIENGEGSEDDFPTIVLTNAKLAFPKYSYLPRIEILLTFGRLHLIGTFSAYVDNFQVEP